MDVSHTSPLKEKKVAKKSQFVKNSKTPSAVADFHRDRNWIQLPKQIAWIVASLAWVFAVTYAIMFVINLIPGCHFRSTEESEIVGMDVSFSRCSLLLPEALLTPCPGGRAGRVRCRLRLPQPRPRGSRPIPTSTVLPPYIDHCGERKSRRCCRRWRWVWVCIRPVAQTRRGRITRSSSLSASRGSARISVWPLAGSVPWWTW